MLNGSNFLELTLSQKLSPTTAGLSALLSGTAFSFTGDPVPPVLELACPFEDDEDDVAPGAADTVPSAGAADLCPLSLCLGSSDPCATLQALPELHLPVFSNWKQIPAAADMRVCVLTDGDLDIFLHRRGDGYRAPPLLLDRGRLRLLG